MQRRLRLRVLIVLLGWLVLLQNHGCTHLHPTAAERLPFQVASMLGLDDKLRWLLRAVGLIEGAGRWVVVTGQRWLGALKLPLILSETGVFDF